MKIVYPYNEILPTGKAHDVYVFNNCASLANAGLDVHLLIGEGGPPDEELFHYYNTAERNLHIHRLPINRGRKFPRWNSNRKFHRACQKWIEREKPDIVITSVKKQGYYHTKRKLPDTRYVYEVHQLEEKELFENFDLVVVTTKPLAKILEDITPPVKVISLATSAKPLPPKQRSGSLRAAYVGQLYPMQGVDLLIEAVNQTEDVHLDIIGGKPDDIERLKAQAGPRIHFHGFQDPANIPHLLKETDCFLMPSANLLDKPHVAHTKLIEYANYKRPIVAPNVPAIEEHLGSLEGVILYEPGNATSLARALSEPMGALPAASFSWEDRAAKYITQLTLL